MLSNDASPGAAPLLFTSHSAGEIKTQNRKEPNDMAHGRMDLSSLGLDFDPSIMKVDHGVLIDPEIIRAPGGQRRVKKVTNITTNFNLLLFDDVVLVEVEDLLYVVDGGHRVSAAKELHLPVIYARVIHGLSMDQANRLCAALNNQKKMFTAKQSNDALIAGHEEVAIYIKETVAALGLTKAPISAMLICVKYGVLQETLEVLAKSGAWEKSKGNGVRFIEGVALLIKDNALTIDLHFLTTILSETSPTSLLVRDDGGIPNACQVRDKLKTVYNTMLGRKKDLFLQ